MVSCVGNWVVIIGCDAHGLLCWDLVLVFRVYCDGKVTRVYDLLS